MREREATSPRVTIVRALPEDASELSSVAYAAKGHWGYPESWLRHWEKVLTVTPDYVRATQTFKAVLDQRVLGFCSVVFKQDEAVIDALWVLPSVMGKGIGRALFEFAENLARSTGADVINVESDPHAEAFYVHMGAVRYGYVAAPMDGVERFLPLLQKTL